MVITGPTAVGKTELSLLLAESLHGEIISADSVQVYKGLDIGSAKVNPGPISSCFHISIVQAAEVWHARVQYLRQAA